MNEKPPIIHIGPTPFFSNRGCHIRILNEIRGIQSTGQHVILCTYGLGEDVVDVDIRRIWRIPGYKKTAAGFSWFKPLADIMLFFLVLSVVLRERATIIHGHLHEGGLIGWGAKTVLFWRSIFLVMDIQGSLSEELRAYGSFQTFPFALKFFFVVERLICAMPDRIACSSEASAVFLVDSCNVDESKIVLVPDVVPVSFFSSPDKNRSRKLTGLPQDKRIVLYTGSLLQGKGIDVLLDALPLMRTNWEETAVVLVGYPKEWVERALCRMKLIDRVILPGEVPYDDLGDWLASADVAVDPKQSGSGEASGKILHYMAAGLPIVCQLSENNRRLLGDQAFYSTDNSARELAAAIDSALADSEAWQIYGRANRVRAREGYSEESAGRQLSELYQGEK